MPIDASMAWPRLWVAPCSAGRGFEGMFLLEDRGKRVSSPRDFYTVSPHVLSLLILLGHVHIVQDVPHSSGRYLLSAGGRSFCNIPYS